MAEPCFIHPPITLQPSNLTFHWMASRQPDAATWSGVTEIGAVSNLSINEQVAVAGLLFGCQAFRVADAKALSLHRQRMCIFRNAHDAAFAQQLQDLGTPLLENGSSKQRRRAVAASYG